MSAFLTVALVHLLGVMSPGPDFAITVKQSLTQPRRVVVWTALGIGLGIGVHVAYCLLGIGFVISRSILLFNAIKLLGAAYLLFIGWKALTAHVPVTHVRASRAAAIAMPDLQALRIGFLTNALNPKATVFFLALFTQVIDPATPLIVQMLYGVYMMAATFVWFTSLGSVLTLAAIRERIHAFHIWVERFMGAVLIALGLKVAFASHR